MKKQLYIYCDGGFANRFNGLVSGLVTAKYANCLPIIVWPSNTWCGAGFQDCFQTNAYRVELHDLSYFGEEKDSYAYVMHENQLHFENVQIYSPHDARSTKKIAKIINDYPHLNVVFYTSLIPNYIRKKDLFECVESLKLKEIYYKESEKFIQMNQLGSYVGLHLRGTDFPNKPDSNLYYSKVKKSQKKYVVCSDDKAVDELFQTLPNAFIFPKTDYTEKLESNKNWNEFITDEIGRKFPFNVNRNAQSVRQALVDLILLSSAKKIVRTSNSTFLDMAYLMKSAAAYKQNRWYRLFWKLRSRLKK